MNGALLSSKKMDYCTPRDFFAELDREFHFTLDAAATEASAKCTACLLYTSFGATVLVPILVNTYGLPLSIQTTLFFAGIGTLFFHLCTKLRVPAFLGSSFAFLGGFAAMGAMDSGIYAGMDGAETVSYTHLDVYKRQARSWPSRP